MLECINLGGTMIITSGLSYLEI